MLRVWTVFDHPSDYPDHYVVRPFQVDVDGVRPVNEAELWFNVDDARAALRRRGLTLVERRPGDDPMILETWV